MSYDENPEVFRSRSVRVGLLILGVGWLAVELRHDSGWGMALAGMMCLFAGYEVFFADRDPPK